MRMSTHYSDFGTESSVCVWAYGITLGSLMFILTCSACLSL